MHKLTHVKRKLLDVDDNSRKKLKVDSTSAMSADQNEDNAKLKADVSGAMSDNQNNEDNDKVDQRSTITFPAVDDTSETGSPTDHKLITFINYVSPYIFEYIVDSTTYYDAIQVHSDLYIKPHNEIYARHTLSTRKQAEGESLDNYIQILKQISKECNFKAVSAEGHRRCFIRDAFKSGIRSREIRQRLLENPLLTMMEAFQQARALEMAHKNAESYHNQSYLLRLELQHVQIKERKKMKVIKYH